jgi:hypothetical protein
MLSVLKLALGWLTGGTLDRILSSVDNKISNDTTREAVKADLVADYMKVQVAILTGRGWWFPLFFIAPLGMWFASVCIYSMLFCARCAFPQSWSIAALPAPLDEWSGIIIGSLFVGKLGQELVARLRK